VKKISFDHAKREVTIALDACTIDTLRRFYNRAFRFIDAYRKGLGIKAASWCVKKQKRHRTISEEAMRAFKSIRRAIREKEGVGGGRSRANLPQKIGHFGGQKSKKSKVIRA
jgi:hypothetical protein